MPDGGASLFATIASAFTAAAPEVGATAGALAASDAAVGAGLMATAGGTVAAGTTAAATGFTLADAALVASGVSGLASTGAQLLADKPKVQPLPQQATRDEAQREADMRSELYRKRGRAAALLTPGGGRGDTSAPSLGAASLLGG